MLAPRFQQSLGAVQTRPHSALRRSECEHPSFSTAPTMGLVLREEVVFSLCMQSLETYLRQFVTHTSSCRPRKKAEKTLE